VESVYGRGSSFHVEIPKVSGDETQIQQRLEHEEIVIYAPDAKILVVDDNTVNLNVAAGLLYLCRITAETAASGKQAIELVQQNQYDIVFMDHRMPEMDGIETAEYIRSLGITLPIIALTANAVVGAKEMMFAAGMDDYLSKPIIKSELMYMLKKWLPAGKLLDTPVKPDAADEGEGAEHEEFWRRIEQIEGLSLSAGLDRVNGQRNIYGKMLKLIIKEIKKSDKNLSEFLAAADMSNFRIEVHGIKGALASIGAAELAAKAYDLEAASDRGDADFCGLNLPTLLEGLNNLRLNLQEAFSLLSRDDIPMEIPPELPPVFARMIDAFAEIDLVLIDTEIKNLVALNLKGALKEEVEQIIDMVKMVDYDGAKEHMQKLLNGA
ncbi:MAG: response regulator, partial [Syntrophobacterales bacterium]|jgi:CheY-like chemotaxis protein/HPt (histidine-containing phosphotransfer) domain-containing protein|nr:response regulator [Syntrophobacterales bacterium]